MKSLKSKTSEFGLPGKKFQKNVQNFTCMHCKSKVKGNGYTNHCPHCLWSRHVDINPGDRNNPCKGAMKPIALEIRKDRYTIVHECEKCGFIAKNKSAPEDDFDELIKLVQKNLPV